jgi:hypothetical protein
VNCLVNIRSVQASPDGQFSIGANIVKNAENFGYRVSAFKKPKIAATQHRLRFLSIDEETRLLNALDINHPDCRMNRYLKPINFIALKPKSTHWLLATS